MSVSLVHSGLATEQRTTQWTPAAVPPTAVSASHFSAEIEQTPVIKWIILLWGEVNKKFQGKKKTCMGMNYPTIGLCAAHF